MTTEFDGGAGGMGHVAASGSRSADLMAGLRRERGVCDIHGEFTAFRRGDALRCPSCVLMEASRDYAAKAAATTAGSGLAVYWNAGRCERKPPARFAGATFDSFVADTDEKAFVLESVRSYAAGFGRGGHNLLMAGMPGTGKTHLAMALVRHLSERGFRAAYLTIFDLLGMAQSWRRSPEPEASIIESLRSFDLAVLDEVGAHADFGWNQDFVLSTIFQLVDSRYMNCLPTVVVTNLDGAALETVDSGLGSRVMDRFKDAISLPFRWQSVRGTVIGEVPAPAAVDAGKEVGRES